MPENTSSRRMLCLVVLLCFAVPCSVGSACACSTFLLKNGSTLIVGHNLDQDFYTPGSLLINQRGTRRRSQCADDLGLTSVQTAPLAWTSRFGSVTFTVLGEGFPDGGMNEAGLVVCEMALPQSGFPHSSEKPTMFIHQWIQYQLDNHASVAEVLNHVTDINIDPRAPFSPVSLANYHFFLADAGGAVAVLEFLDGQAVVHSQDALVVPALCNAPYADEMQRYRTFSGLIGSVYRRLDSRGDHRFLVCADGLEEYAAGRHQDGTAFALDLLTRMQFERTRQWSIVYDIGNQAVAFRTVGGPEIKTLRLSDVEFSADADASMLEDIDAIESGDVAGALQPFTEAANRRAIDRFLGSLVGFVAKSDSVSVLNEYMQGQHGMTLEELTDRAHGISTAARYED